MSCRFTTRVRGLVALALLAGASGAAVGQEPAPRAGAVFPMPAGPMGFSTTARIGVFLDPSCPVTAMARGSCSNDPVVTGVVDGSPASEAGIRPGDRLVALDGVKLRTEAGRRSLGRLRAGVPVRLDVVSDGESRRIRIIPEPRPAEGRFTIRKLPGEVQAPDAGVEDVRVFRLEDRGGRVAEFHFRQDSALDVRFAPAEGFVVFSEDRGGQLDVRVETVAPGEAAFVLDGERVAAAELESMLERLGRVRGQGPLEIDVEVRKLGSTAEGIESGSARLVIESEELAERLKSIREHALEAARHQLAFVRNRTEELAARGEVPPQVGVGYAYAYEAPSGSPPERYLMQPAPTAPGSGDGRLAGAEFRTLNAELGEYFGLDEGLLVLRVIPETPAARLGLRGGDVVIEAGSRAGLSLNEFRRLVAESRAGHSPLRVKWVRKGQQNSGDLAFD